MTIVGFAGLVVLARRHRPRRDVLLLFAPLVVVAFSAVASYGNPRFGAIARPVLAIGIAVVMCEVVDRARASRPLSRRAETAPSLR